MLCQVWPITCPTWESSKGYSLMFTDKLKNMLASDLKKKKKIIGLSCCDSCWLKSPLRNTNIQVFYWILLIQKLPLEPLDSFCFALHFYSHLLQIFYLKYFVWKLIKMLLWKESATLPPSLCLMAQDLSHKFILIKLRFSRCSLSCNPYVIVPNIFSTIDVTLNRLLLPAILIMALTLFLYSLFSFKKIFFTSKKTGIWHDKFYFKSLPWAFIKFFIIFLMIHNTHKGSYKYISLNTRERALHFKAQWKKENRSVNGSLASFIWRQWCYRWDNAWMKMRIMNLTKMISNHCLFHRCSKGYWFLQLSGCTSLHMILGVKKKKEPNLRPYVKS